MLFKDRSVITIALLLLCSSAIFRTYGYTHTIINESTKNVLVSIAGCKTSHKGMCKEYCSKLGSEGAIKIVPQEQVTLESSCKRLLFKVQYGKSYNRTVYIKVGPPENAKYKQQNMTWRLIEKAPNDVTISPFTLLDNNTSGWKTIGYQKNDDTVY